LLEGSPQDLANLKILSAATPRGDYAKLRVTERGSGRPIKHHLE
jgi:hypothetical protein